MRPFVTAGRKPQAGHGRSEETLGLGGDRAEASNLAGAHRRVDPDAARVEAVALPLARGGHARPDRLGRVADRRALHIARFQRGELDVQIDAVEERAREATEIAGALGGRAHAAVERRAAAPARIGCGDELEAGGKIADAARPRDRDPTVFERLAQRLEHVLLEFR